jgi:hypothetical protein
MATLFRLFPTGQPMPGALQLASNALHAGARAALSAMSGKMVFVSNERREANLAICRACPNLNRDQMRCALPKCGCFVELKTLIATERCPDEPPRWDNTKP